MSGDNVYVQAKTGNRFCRECKRIKAREYYFRKRGVTEVPPKRVWGPKRPKPQRPSLYTRFMERVEHDGDHWLWMRHPTIFNGDRDETANRVSMKLFGVGVAEGPLMQVRSTCGESRCVHPDHLENVSCRPAGLQPERACECGRDLPKYKRTCDECRAQREGDYFISKSDREWVYKRDGYACLKCGSPEDLTIDHVMPRALGGPDARSNYQTLCRTCNASKNATYADYRRLADGQLALVLRPVPATSLRDRFMAKVDAQLTGCWLWTGAKFNGITPAMRVEGRSISAAQVAWTEFIGELPDERIYRTCRTTECVNPQHLTVERAASYGTPDGTCRNGHNGPFQTVSDGTRRCITCRRASHAAWYARKKQEQALV